ncbi:MAG: glucose-1-phosphate thymidylyltransferase [Deltaproteobacteria bacterium]|nr:glucose-1-phosphate thymidylyltransferase [Deltaproteobacteria bacterium]
MLRSEDFFELSEFEPRDIFSNVEFVWEALSKIKPFVKGHLVSNVGSLVGDMLSKTHVLWNDEIIPKDDVEIEAGDITKGDLKVSRKGEELPGASVVCAGAVLVDSQIQIGKGTVVEPGVLIKGPTIIGDHTEVRQGAYLRGSCLIGNRCVVGHTTEVKNAIMMNDAKAGHFAYIGDSILGNDVNLGAGTKLANLKIIDAPVMLNIEGKFYKTGLRKFGAILGDNVQTGCNSVTSPGTLLGKGALVYPCLNVPAGYFPPKSIIDARAIKRPFKKRFMINRFGLGKGKNSERK